MKPRILYLATADARGHLMRAQLLSRALIERGAWAEHDRVEDVRAARGLAAPGDPRIAVVRETNLFDRWEQAIWSLDTLLRKLRGGTALAADLIRAADAQVALVDRDPDVALFMANRQEGLRYALYALTHSLHTATPVLLDMGGETVRFEKNETALVRLRVEF